MARFRTKLAALKENTRYLELSLRPYTGNTSDCFKTPVPVARACGEKQNYGTLFAYLFRRFGYPNIGWDEYKQLTSYYLRTPLSDMILYVVPYVGDDTSLHFKFIVEGETYEALENYDREARDARGQRELDWIEKNNLLPEWMDDFIKAYCEQVEPVGSWRDTFSYMSLISYGNRDDGDQRRKLIVDWYNDVTARYKEIEPDPGHRTRSPDWTEWADDDPLKKYHQAAYDTLMDLKRPVCVRDQYIDAFGSIDENGADFASRLRSEVRYAAVSGYPAGEIANVAPEEFSELHGLIYKLGKGNAKKGLKKVLALCESVV